jgi:hypothetical protein
MAFRSLTNRGKLDLDIGYVRISIRGRVAYSRERAVQPGHQHQQQHNWWIFVLSTLEEPAFRYISESNTPSTGLSIAACQTGKTLQLPHPLAPAPL